MKECPAVEGGIVEEVRMGRGREGELEGLGGREGGREGARGRKERRRERSERKEGEKEGLGEREGRRKEHPQLSEQLHATLSIDVFE